MAACRKLKVIVNGRPYLVEVGDLSKSPLEVKVNGRLVQVGIEMADADGETAATYSGSITDVSPGVSLAAAAVTAPMPGNITDILVDAGDMVNKDQVLCTLEAMKMQNAIRSPRDGVIAEIGVTSGQAVGYGEILFTFR